MADDTGAPTPEERAKEYATSLEVPRVGSSSSWSAGSSTPIRATAR